MLEWPRGLNDLGSVLVNLELIFDTTKLGLARKIRNFPFPCGQIGPIVQCLDRWGHVPLHLYLLAEIPKLTEEVSIKSITTSKGSGA